MTQTPQYEAAEAAATPARIRSMFGQNLRELARGAPSITALSRALGINRTQLNRYLRGESFPRPDVLYTICRFFGTDARILTQPLHQIEPATAPGLPPILEKYFGPGAAPITEAELPSGFYRLVRRSFLLPDKYLQSVIYIYRDGPNVMLRGYVARGVLTQLEMDSSVGNRAYLGPITRRAQGFMCLVGSRANHGITFRYFAPYQVLDRRLWEGFIIEPIQERHATRRTSRTVMEYIPGGLRDALPVARDNMPFDPATLGPVYETVLRPHDPFT